MARKIQVPSIGGLRKVIAGAPASTATTISGLEGQSVTLQQLALALGTIPAASSGTSGSAVGGGGSLASPVVKLPTFPFILADDGGGDDGGIVPGPPGKDGIVGVNGSPGTTVLLPADEYDDPVVIPGTPGQHGTNGANGSPGTTVFMPADEYDDPVIIPGTRGPSGANGTNGLPGLTIFIVPDEAEDQPVIPGVGSPTSSSGGGVTTHFGSGAPSTLYSTGDLYFDTSSGVPLTGYVQTNLAVTPSTGTVATGIASTTTATSTSVTTALGQTLLVVVAAAELAVGVSSVTGITCGSLVFTKYASSASAGNTVSIEVWTAPLTGVLTAATLTVTYGAAFDDSTLAVFGVSNFANWDAGSGLPAAASGIAGPTLGPITTTVASDLLLYVGSTAIANSGGTPAGYTQIANVTNNGGSLWSFTQVAIYAPAAILTGYTLTAPTVGGTPAFLLAAISPAVGGSWQRFA